MHEDEIRVARWRIRLVAAVGVSLLSLTVAVLVFPVAVVVFAAFALLGASWGFGLGLLVWSAAVSAAFGLASGAGVFAWSLARAERRALEMVRAWPYPGSPPAPPPRLPPGTYERAQQLAPFAVLLTPVVGGGMLLRAAALGTRARLG